MSAKNLSVARRGAAGGPSGMTSEHLHRQLWRAQDLTNAAVPEEVVDAIRLGRLTVFQKPNGGVRGIVSILRALQIIALCQGPLHVGRVHGTGL